MASTKRGWVGTHDRSLRAVCTDKVLTPATVRRHSRRRPAGRRSGPNRAVENIPAVVVMGRSGVSTSEEVACTSEEVACTSEEVA